MKTNHPFTVGLAFALSSIVLTLLSCTSGSVTEALDQTPTSTLNLETFESNTNYLADCKNITSKKVDAQVGYRSIYPGRTPKEEVEGILGKPLRVNETSWEYDDAAIILDDSLVRQVFASPDKNTILKDMIQEYGCPDIIYALDIHEEHQGIYSRLLFIYAGIGLDFTVDKYPAELHESVTNTSYFVPGTLEYYSQEIYPLDVPNTSKLVSWSEAIR